MVESEGNVEMLSVEVTALQEKVASLEEECQDRCRMANEWYEALKVSECLVPFQRVIAHQVVKAPPQL